MAIIAVAEFRSPSVTLFSCLGGGREDNLNLTKCLAITACIGILAKRVATFAGVMSRLGKGGENGVREGAGDHGTGSDGAVKTAMRVLGTRFRTESTAGARAAGRGLVERLARYPIVSCDIFDTALVRELARPADVLLAVGARARACGLITCDAAAFRVFRLAAEDAAREAARDAGHDEVRISEVYEYLAAQGLVSDPVAAAALEFATERTVCRPVPALRDTLATAAPGQRLIFLSDSILPGAWLATLLAENGFGGACEVISSADARRSKASGRLFAWLLAHLGVAARDIIHLGDNPVSDIAHARAHGLATHLLRHRAAPPEDEAVAAGDVTLRLLHSRRRAPRPAPVGRRAGGDVGGAEGGEKPLAHYISLLMLGFALFVLAEARRLGIRRIYFTARDGYLPLAIARRIAAKRGDPVELHYLEVSRQSIVLPGLGDDPKALAEALAHTVSGDRLAAILAPLGVAAETVAPLLAGLGFDPARIVEDEVGLCLAAAERLIATQPALISAALAARREAALGYLAGEDFLVPGRRMIVDIGWHGSIQRHLARLAGLADEDLFGCYLGLFPAALRRGLTPRTASGYLFSFGHPEPLCDLIREGPVLLELFFSAPHGSVAHYVAAEGRFRAVHAIEQAPAGAIRAAFFAALERDCLAEIDALAALLDGAWPDHIDPASALFDIAGLLRRPNAREVRAINTIPFVHGIDGRRISAAINPLPLHELLLRPLASLQRLATAPAGAPWRAGAVRASLPWPLPDMTHAEFRHRVSQLRRLLGLR